MNKRILDTNFHFHGTSHSFLFESLKSKPAMTWSAKLCTRGPWKHQAKASRKVLNFYQFVIISHTKIEISKTYGLVNPNFPPRSHFSSLSSLPQRGPAWITSPINKLNLISNPQSCGEITAILKLTIQKWFFLRFIQVLLKVFEIKRGLCQSTKKVRSSMNLLLVEPNKNWTKPQKTTAHLLTSFSKDFSKNTKMLPPVSVTTLNLTEPLKGPSAKRTWRDWRKQLLIGEVKKT